MALRQNGQKCKLAVVKLQNAKRERVKKEGGLFIENS